MASQVEQWSLLLTVCNSSGAHKYDVPKAPTKPSSRRLNAVTHVVLAESLTPADELQVEFGVRDPASTTCVTAMQYG